MPPNRPGRSSLDVLAGWARLAGVCGLLATFVFPGVATAHPGIPMEPQQTLRWAIPQTLPVILMPAASAAGATARQAPVGGSFHAG